MSTTDFQFLQDLPQIHLSSIKIHPPQPSSQDDPINDENKNNKRTDNDPGSSRIERTESEKDDEGCQTPKSDQNKIPAMLNCPPAPRKPTRRVVSCKRKLTEFEFFEIVNRNEIDRFFASAFEVSGGDGDVSSTKRSCCHCK